MGIYADTGALKVTVNDTTGKGYYAADGSARVTLVPGTSFTGLYASDGSMNVVDEEGSLYHPCGAIRGRAALVTYTGLSSPSGALYMSGLVPSVFSPLSLFAASEPGVWYDPSDIERYMATGSELVSNGDFSSGSTGWTLGSGWSVSSGVASVVAPGAAADLSANITLTAGRTYQITCTISNYSAGTVTPRFSGGTNSIGSNFPASNGTFTQFLVARTGNNILVFRTNTTANLSVDNISVKELVDLGTATMFQDVDETIPVTDVEQPVALIKDRSRVALSDGSELVNNGTFDSTATGWTTTNATAASVSGELEVTGSGGFYPRVDQSIAVTSGKFYRVSITMRRGTATANVYYNVPGSTPDVQSSSTTNQTYTFIVRASSSTLSITLGIYNGAASGTVYFDNISVREIRAYHAYQTTAASRPVLSARVNLFNFTDDLATTTSWSTLYISGMTRNGASITVDNNEAYGYLGSNYVTLRSIQYRVSFDVTCNQTVSDIPIRVAFDTAGVSVLQSLTAGVTTRISLLITVTANTAIFGIGVDTRDAIVPGGSNTTGYTVTFGRPDIRPAYISTSIPTYQRVSGSSSYDKGGFPYYLKFDGVDDFLQTTTITPGTDKAQVFAGIQKLSDAASAILIEASATVNSNAGTINLFAPSGAAANYTTASRGSAAAVVASYTNAAIAAPVTNQVTVLSDISGDSLILRANGSDVAQSTSDQGTGNFTAQPFYIGRRAGTSTPFNGYMYNLIVRFGSNLPASTITDTETWVNGKTKAY